MKRKAREWWLHFWYESFPTGTKLKCVAWTKTALKKQELSAEGMTHVREVLPPRRRK